VIERFGPSRSARRQPAMGVSPAATLNLWASAKSSRDQERLLIPTLPRQRDARDQGNIGWLEHRLSAGSGGSEDISGFQLCDGNERLHFVAWTPGTFSGRGHAEAKAGKNFAQNQRDAVSEKLTHALCVSRWAAVLYALRALWQYSSVVRLLAARRGLFLGAAMIQRIPQMSFRSAAATRLQRASRGRECT
jgi:hypothetical protein